MTQPKTNLAERIIRNGNLETTYSAEDFVNPGSYESSSAFGREQKAFVILAGGFVQAIVFSEYHGYTESDALDEALVVGRRCRMTMANPDGLGPPIQKTVAECSALADRLAVLIDEYWPKAGARGPGYSNIPLSVAVTLGDLRIYLRILAANEKRQTK